MSSTSHVEDNVRGAIMGMFIADALGMPVHWYYAPGSIEKEFGTEGIQTYHAPKHPHPEAFVWSMDYKGTIDILHGVEKYLTKTKPAPEDNPHYHKGLEAGDITLNMQLARVCLGCLGGKGVELKEWAQAFVDFMRTPSPAVSNDIHRDVYIRRFFERMSEGLPLKDCPIPQQDIWSVGSMGGCIPAILTGLTFSTEGTSEKMVERCIEMHLKTHNSENVSEAVRVLVPLIVDLVRMPKPDGEFAGDAAEVSYAPDLIDPRRRRILEAAKSVVLTAVTGPSLSRRYREAKGPGNIPKDEMYKLHTAKRPGVVFDPSMYMDVPDEYVISGQVGIFDTACYTEHAVPSMLYLAYKYFHDPAEAIRRNIKLLGDIPTRGCVLACILGAAHGMNAWPADWVSGLRQSTEIQQDVAEYMKRTFA